MSRYDTIESTMREALAGDKRAYAQVLEQSVALLRPYLTKRLSHKSDIDDVLQEILLSVHKARHTYDGKRPFTPWLFAIARFRLHDYLRAHYKDQLRYADELTDAENIFAQNVTETTLTYESISEEIHRLPKKQAVILQMIHQQGYTAKEVADKTGMSESAVKVAAHRAYKVLKKKLED